VLETYHYEIQHRPGLKHGNADALSRGPCQRCGRESHDASPTCQETGADKTQKVTTRSQGRKEQEEKKSDMWMEDGVQNRCNLEMKQAEDEDVSWVIGYKKKGVKPT